MLPAFGKLPVFSEILIIEFINSSSDASLNCSRDAKSVLLGEEQSLEEAKELHNPELIAKAEDKIDDLSRELSRGIVRGAAKSAVTVVWCPSILSGAGASALLE
jgi:hypothetical protein